MSSTILHAHSFVLSIAVINNNNQSARICDLIDDAVRLCERRAQTRVNVWCNFGELLFVWYM
jgi:hypothetical protein